MRGWVSEPVEKKEQTVRSGKEGAYTSRPIGLVTPGRKGGAKKVENL
jgi:hypothetical protein